MTGRSSFAITPRLSTIHDSEQLLAIKSGEIIERGTYNPLMAQHGFYYSLFKDTLAGVDSEKVIGRWLRRELSRTVIRHLF
jgi:ABC-type transport system involved in cytochrome bd biosynthesis fused ATPase/permease subunit